MRSLRPLDKGADAVPLPGTSPLGGWGREKSAVLTLRGGGDQRLPGLDAVNHFREHALPLMHVSLRAVDARGTADPGEAFGVERVQLDIAEPDVIDRLLPGPFQHRPHDRPALRRVLARRQVGAGLALVA